MGNSSGAVRQSSERAACASAPRPWGGSLRSVTRAADPRVSGAAGAAGPGPSLPRSGRALSRPASPVAAATGSRRGRLDPEPPRASPGDADADLRDGPRRSASDGPCRVGEGRSVERGTMKRLERLGGALSVFQGLGLLSLTVFFGVLFPRAGVATPEDFANPSKYHARGGPASTLVLGARVRAWSRRRHVVRRDAVGAVAAPFAEGAGPDGDRHRLRRSRSRSTSAATSSTRRTSRL